MLTDIIGKRIEVELLCQDLKSVYCKAYLTIEEEHSLLELTDNNEIGDLKINSARLKNGDLILLISGIIQSLNFNSFHPHKVYKYFETLYMDNYFKDLYNMVSCRIPQISNWFSRKFYCLRKEENSTSLHLENETCFTFNFQELEVILYREVLFNVGKTVNIQPITYIKVKCNNLLERYELFDILNCSKQFYQSFFRQRFNAFNLVFQKDEFNVISHSRRYPYKKEILLEDGDLRWFAFDEIKDDIPSLFSKWMENKLQNLTIEDLFSDSFANPASINRFLSAMRILEILSKRIVENNVLEEVKRWKEKIKVTHKSFNQCWVLRPFIQYKILSQSFSDDHIVTLIENRNYYTHGKDKTEGTVDIQFLPKLTHEVLAVAKALFFLQLGIDEKLVPKVLHSFSHYFYDSEPVDNEYSSFYRKKK